MGRGDAQVFVTIYRSVGEGVGGVGRLGNAVEILIRTGVTLSVSAFGSRNRVSKGSGQRIWLSGVQSAGLPRHAQVPICAYRLK